MTHYGQEEGLEASTTYIIDQDRDGFMWVGSDNGLYRFDGSVFTQYAQKDGLPNIDVLHPIALSNGEVFIIPFASNVAVQRNGRIVTPGTDRELAKIRGGAGHFVANVDKRAQTVALFENTAPRNIYLYRDGRVTAYPVLLPETKSPFSAICYDFDGKLLLSNASKVYEYDIFARRLRERVLKEGNEIKTFRWDRGQYMNASGRLPNGMFLQWAENRIRMLRKAEGHYEVTGSIELSENIYYIAQHDRHRLWVCFTGGGAVLVDITAKRAVVSEKFLPGYIINNVKADRDGNIWFSTKNDGLFFMPCRQFENYLGSPFGRDFTPATAIAAKGPRLFVGYSVADAGIYQAGKLQKIALEPKLKFETRSIFPTESNVVYSNLNSFGISLRDFRKTRVPLRLVKNMNPVGPGAALFCTSDSLFTYEPETGKKTFIDNHRYYSALGHGDSVLAGSVADVWKIDARTHGKKLFLKDVFFTDMKLLGHRFIAGTNGYGVCLFDNKKIRSWITMAGGLASNQVKKIYVQDDKTVWCSTTSGLSRISFSAKNPSVMTFTRTDGLPSDRVSDCLVRNDTVFAATSKGVGILPLADLLRQRRYLSTSVYVNSVVLDGKKYIPPGDGITADYSGNPVLFNLSFPHYISLGKVSYRYRIKGLTDQWQTVQSPKIVLNAPPPGKYTLEVYGLAYDGKRSARAKSLTFEIRPLFWQTWWFRLLCTLALIGVVAWAVTYLMQRRRDKNLRAALYDKKIAELELQAIKAQVNPHFIYNCLNSIQYLLYKKDYAETENYLGIFARMIRSTLHYSEKTFMPVREEIEYLHLYLDMEKLRFKSGFSYEITAAPETLDMEIPSLLIQPFVENALKHGIAVLKDRDGRIEISFTHDGDALEITIRDNGVGISDPSVLSRKLDSYGIRLSQKRVETFRQLFAANIALSIADLSEKGSHGTEIILKFRHP